jgi:copper(I)-binding protein
MYFKLKEQINLSLILAFMSTGVYASGFADETQDDARDVAATTAASQDMQIAGAGAGAAATATATEATALATAIHASVNFSALELLAPADRRMTLAEFHDANIREDMERMNTCTHIVIDAFVHDMTDQ